MGKGALPSPGESAGAVHPSAGGLGTQGGHPREGPPSAPNPRLQALPPSPLHSWSTAIRVGGPRPQAPPHYAVLPRCPSFPTSGPGPSSAQRHGLCWGRATAQMLRALLTFSSVR